MLLKEISNYFILRILTIKKNTIFAPLNNEVVNLKLITKDYVSKN